MALEATDNEQCYHDSCKNHNRILGGALMATSKLQRQTAELLSIHFGQYTIHENSRPDWLITDRGERIELDFHLPQVDIAIEVQGMQHFQYVEHFHLTPANFEAQKRRDKFKANRCDEYGVWLFEVFDDVSLETVINDIKYLIKTGRKRHPRKVREFWSTEEGHDNQWYGMAPHHHNLAVTGSFIGSTVLDPLPEPNEHGEYWIADMGAWFKPDDEVDGAQGMWRKP